MIPTATASNGVVEGSVKEAPECCHTPVQQSQSSGEDVRHTRGRAKRPFVIQPLVGLLGDIGVTDLTVYTMVTCTLVLPFFSIPFVYVPQTRGHE